MPQRLNATVRPGAPHCQMGLASDSSFGRIMLASPCKFAKLELSSGKSCRRTAALKRHRRVIARPVSAEVSGGGRESNPPTAQRAIPRF